MKFYLGIAAVVLVVVVLVIRKLYMIGKTHGLPEDRLMLGAERVGTPAREVVDAVARMQEMDEYQAFRHDVIDFYCDRMIGGELISLIDEALGLKELSALNPDVVKVAFILLLRDVLQRFRKDIVLEELDDTRDQMRVEQFTAGLCYESEAPMQPYLDWLERVSDEAEEPSELLVAALAKQLGVDPKDLYEYQNAAYEVIEEDFLSQSGG